ncbi:hypothetical protein D3C87_864350 [compost metagenome]
MAQLARPDQVVRAQQLESARHLLRIEVALLPHGRFQEADLALVDEQRQFARLLEVHLRRQHGEAGQARIAVARHRRGGDRQQGAAQAVAGRVHLRRARDADNGVERVHHAQLAVVFQRQLAVFFRGVFPGNHEHRVALAHQIAHQRIVRRQVEDIELHDPRGHEQQWRRMHLGGRGRVLYQFNQVVAVDHLARRDGHVLAHLVAARVGGIRSHGGALPVFGQVLRAARQAGAAALEGRLLHHGIGQHEV